MLFWAWPMSSETRGWHPLEATWGVLSLTLHREEQGQPLSVP